MKSSIVILLFTFGLVTSISCDKKGDILMMHFNETYCANPWQVSSSDPDYQNKVKEYLENKGVDIRAISITNDGSLSGCFSCFCTSGIRINILIFEKDKKIVEGIGFVADE